MITESKKDLEELSHYTPTQMAVELTCLVIFGAANIYNVFDVVRAKPASWIIIVMAFVGIVAADFVAGVVHWAADTWGDTTWPIVGKTLIRSFREHHVDQKAITRHGFVETNGASAMVSLPFVLGACFLSSQTTLFILIKLFISSFTFFILFTNQIHKWSHLDKCPLWVEVLQNFKIILPRKHHAYHHSYPYMIHYCITTGWLNPILDGVGFFRGAEFVINKVTGAIPRKDDHRLHFLKRNN